MQVLYRYNPATDVWTELSITPVGIGFPVGGFIGGKLYATGGPNGALLAYDPSTNQWTTKKAMPDPRSSPAGVTLGAKLYVVGGSVIDAAGTRTAVRQTSVYDPATDSWTNGALMPTARSELAAGRVVVNGKARIEAVGGARPGNNVQYVP